MRHILLAGLTVLAASSDWGLVDQSRLLICAKDRASCEAALAAYRRGWLPSWRLEGGVCVPVADCFTPQSECIQGYNCEPK